MILAFDLSLSNTGIAVFDDKGKCKKLISIKTNEKQSHSLRLRQIEKVMRSLKKEYKPNLIIIEEGFSRYNKSTQAIYKCRGVTDLIFWNVPQIAVNVKTIRKVLIGNGNANKEEVQNYILNKYKKIKFLDTDQSDAFAVGLYYFTEKGVL